MILGIISAILYLLVIGVGITKLRPAEGKIHGFFLYIHKPLGCLLVVVSLIHLILTLPLIHQRPIIIYILGLMMVLSMLTSIGAYFLRNKMKGAMRLHKILALIIFICLVLHIYFNVTSLNMYQRNVSAITVTGLNLSSIPDGRYVGEYDVEYIFAKVEVHVSDGTITDIRIIEHRNEYGEKGEGVINRILEQQRLDVDAISGATNSSNVIKKAVENALKIVNN